MSARASGLLAVPAVPAPNRLTEPLADVLGRAPADWAPLVQAWCATPDGQRLLQFVARRQTEGAVIYPAQVLRALDLTPRAAVRVVILGQDPYHGAGQAEGLAFSVPAGVKPPPSLRNILDEICRSLGLARPPTGHLGGWARQGVLLLNTSLTVEDGRPAAHARQGWEALTDALISATAADPGEKIYLLWGVHAQRKAGLIASACTSACAGRHPVLMANHPVLMANHPVLMANHPVLMANHPSPLSARRPPVPFVGCDHFSQVQDFLRAQGSPAIDWTG